MTNSFILHQILDLLFQICQLFLHLDTFKLQIQNWCEPKSCRLFLLFFFLFCFFKVSWHEFANHKEPEPTSRFRLEQILKYSRYLQVSPGTLVVFVCIFVSLAPCLICQLLPLQLSLSESLGTAATTCRCPSMLFDAFLTNLFQAVSLLVSLNYFGIISPSVCRVTPHLVCMVKHWKYLEIKLLGSQLPECHLFLSSTEQRNTNPLFNWCDNTVIQYIMFLQAFHVVSTGKCCKLKLRISVECISYIKPSRPDGYKRSPFWQARCVETCSRLQFIRMLRLHFLHVFVSSPSCPFCPCERHSSPKQTGIQSRFENTLQQHPAKSRPRP